jgi:hypothetical protein
MPAYVYLYEYTHLQYVLWTCVIPQNIILAELKRNTTTDDKKLQDDELNKEF